MMKKSERMTADKVKEIKFLLNTGLYFQHQIAALANVNQGRVSEVKQGHYG
jgi:predicted XRE-type DNA-binding protein